MENHRIEVTDATFEVDVMERSKQLPVIVDLWAKWCGPCLTLGPILSDAVEAMGGKVELVTVDVDENPRVAATYRIQTIPMVVAMRHRSILDSFVGAQAEQYVRAWVARVAAGTEVDALLDAGDEQSLRRVLQIDPINEQAILSLADLLAGDSHPERREEARMLLSKLPEDAEVRHILAKARVGGEVEGGRVDVSERLDALLERVRDDEAARQEFIDLLEVLGPEDPRTAHYRKALTAKLF